MRMRLFLLVVLAIVSCQEAEQAGSFGVRFQWPGGTRPTGTWYAWASLQQDRRVVQTAGPVTLFAGEALDFAGVPYGDGYVILVEIRRSTSPSDRVTFYGTSESFSLEPGVYREVPVELELRATPGYDIGGGRLGIDVEFWLDGEARTIVSSSTVELHIDATGAAAIRVANNPSLLSLEGDSSGVATKQVADLSTDANGYSVWGAWDLDASLETEVAELDGVRSVYVQTFDDLEYASQVYWANTLLDRLQPTVVLTDIRVEASECALPTLDVTGMTDGGKARLTLVTSEVLLEAPVVTASGDSAALEVALATGETVSPTSWPFDLTCTSCPAGTYTVAVTLTDPARNITSADVATLEVLPTHGTLEVAQAQVSLVRSPNGNLVEEAFGDHEWPSGVYYALAPADSHSSDTSLPASTFGYVDGTHPIAVRVWNDAQMSNAMGLVTANADGTWPRATLLNLDTPSVWVTGVDAACTETPPVEIQNVTWLATPHPRGLVNSQHEVSSAPLARTAPGTTVLDIEPGLQADVASHGRDGNAVTRSTEGGWRPVPVSADWPAQRSVFAMAYDSWRDRVVVFGGYSEAFEPDLSDTWEWDGTRWHRVPVTGPSARAEAVMAFDAHRGKVVLHGGDAAGWTLFDTWEWDGVAWELLTEAGANSKPHNAKMVYDANRGAVVLVSQNLGEAALFAWQWDGAVWHLITDQGPPDRNEFALAYEPTTGDVLLASGAQNSVPGVPILDDLWALRGDTWVELVSAGAGELDERVRSDMFFDASRGQVVHFGGGNHDGPTTDMWAWRGTSWLDITPADGLPEPHRYQLGAVSRHAWGDAWFFGGDSGAQRFDDLWHWDGSTWRQRLPPGQPPPLANSTMAYDAGRERLVMFGGCADPDFFNCRASDLSSSTWEFDGISWQEVATTGPSARWDARLVYDPGSGILLFGGGNESFEEVPNVEEHWVWDGESWSMVPLSMGVSPWPRIAPSVAYDEGSGELVLFGGFATLGGGLRTDTRIWTGSTWNTIWSTTGLEARSHAGIVYDRANDNIVLYGGCVDFASGRCSEGAEDTWIWDGSGWTEVAIGAGPPARAGHSLIYDPARGTVLCVGGFVVDAGGIGDLDVPVDDIWEFDGTDWQLLPADERLPYARGAAAVAVDEARGRVTVFGGFGPDENPAEDWRAETWIYVEDQTAQPDSIFTVDLTGLAVPLSRVTGVRVRVWAGATAAFCDPTCQAQDGAVLEAWAVGGEVGAIGGWLELDANDATLAATDPHLPDAGAAAMVWDSANATQAQSLLTNNGITVRVRPFGTAGDSRATVGVDFVEVSVRYTMP